MENIIDINLLPQKKKRKHLSKVNRQIITIGIIFLILIALIYGGLRFQLYNRENYLTDLKDQIAKLKDVEELLNKRQQLGDELYYYETTIEKYIKSQVAWNNLINELADCLPKETVIDTFSVDREKNLATITGRTLDVQKLAWTFNSLKSHFDNVVLTNYSIPFEKEKTKTGEQFVTFTFTFQWKEIKK